LGKWGLGEWVALRGMVRTFHVEAAMVPLNTSFKLQQLPAERIAFHRMIHIFSRGYLLHTYRFQRRYRIGPVSAHRNSLTNAAHRCWLEDQHLSLSQFSNIMHGTAGRSHKSKSAAPVSCRVRCLSAFTAVAVALSTASAPSLETSTPSALLSIYRRLKLAEHLSANMLGLSLRNELLTRLAQ
jgi:hypothetical protein